MIESIPSPVAPVKKQVWGFWTTIGLGLATGVIFVLVQTLTVIIFAVVNMANSPDLDVSQLIDQLLENGDLLSTTTIASAVLCVGFILLMVKARRGESIAGYLALKSISKKAVILMFAVTIGFLIVSYVIGLFLPETTETGYMTSAYDNAALKPLFWIAVVIFAPVFEEVFMRGFLFIGFRQSRIGPVGAIILTTLLWAPLHLQYDIFQIAIIFILGIILGIVRHKTDSLLSPLIIHSFNNLVAMVLMSIV